MLGNFVLEYAPFGTTPAVSWVKDICVLPKNMRVGPDFSKIYA